MARDDRSYHLRRAAAHRTSAERAEDPKVADVHLTIAGLHEQRAGWSADSRHKVLSLFPRVLA